MCKFAPVWWYWAIREEVPEQFEAVVDYEARALRRNPKLLVFPRYGVPLPEAVRRWRAENPDATIDAVMSKDYKRCDKGGVAKPSKVAEEDGWRTDPVGAWLTELEARVASPS